MPLPLSTLRRSVTGHDGLASPRATPRAERDQKKPRTGDADTSRIKVVVRKRPLSARERETDTTGILEVKPTPAGTPACMMVHEPKIKVDLTQYTEQHRFLYDNVFDEGASNAEVYRNTAAPLISRIFQAGQMSTCFAYGATGSGKTHTMMGTDESPGLYLLAAADLFSMLALPQHEGLQLHIASFEIYGGKVFDLLSGRPDLRNPLPIREDAKKKMNIVGLSEIVVPSMAEFKARLMQAAQARATAATLANADSSRSHAILQLSIKRPVEPKELGFQVKLRSTRHATEAPAQPTAEEVGRFAFIDLAGTERGADTLNCSNKERQIEGAEINKSLLALKECIRGLDQGKTHVPFRGSKLTEVLRDSFIGDCHTVMIGAVSPYMDSVEQTLNTLRYTSLVKVSFDGLQKASEVPNAAEEEKENQRTLVVDTASKTTSSASALAVKAPPSSAELFEAHRGFITSCVEQLEVHTWMLQQAEGQPAEGISDYVGGLAALLSERQAALHTLQAQLAAFQNAAEA